MPRSHSVLCMPQDTQQGTGEGSRQSADAANELIFHLFAAYWVQSGGGWGEVMGASGSAECKRLIR